MPRQGGELGVVFGEAQPLILVEQEGPIPKGPRGQQDRPQRPGRLGVHPHGMPAGRIIDQGERTLCGDGADQGVSRRSGSGCRSCADSG